MRETILRPMTWLRDGVIVDSNALVFAKAQKYPLTINFSWERGVAGLVSDIERDENGVVTGEVTYDWGRELEFDRETMAMSIYCNELVSDTVLMDGQLIGSLSSMTLRAVSIIPIESLPKEFK